MGSSYLRRSDPSTENRTHFGRQFGDACSEILKACKVEVGHHREDGDAQSPPFEEVREAIMERLY